MDEGKGKFFRCHKLRPEWDYNPLSSYPRNDPCFCGSGKKSKKCCLNKIPKAVPKELVKYMAGKSIGSQASILLNYLRSQQENKQAMIDTPSGVMEDDKGANPQ